MLVGDIVLSGRNMFRVIGIYLGAVGTQDLVGLESLVLNRGYAGGFGVGEMLVPKELVDAADGVFRRIENL